ncbi:synaptotagmin-like protein 2 isoform X2 [Pungitius pungitius]|uniref:synaptotagmin-like protein 2 isoform X2 n=1 Tax=Pungitius pungitius TaxID=134920 RepID=UPI002E10E1C5
MIDLSYLTEEEQGAIMTVMRRDAELKKAEEERIRKLEKIRESKSQLDSQLKYRTGEWFYEAKSRRHMDKIHGSEIILASMKQRKAGLDGSLRLERLKTPSSRGSDIAAPPKPARCSGALQPQEINNAEKENINSEVRSPRTESSETEPISPLKRHPAESSRTSTCSLASEGSSAAFRPVPKKRTFRSRRTSSQSDSNSLPLDSPGEAAGNVPTPRPSLQRGSSENSNWSSIKGQDEIPQKTLSNTAQPSKPQGENLQQPLCDVSQHYFDSGLKKERHPPSITRDRLATYTRSDASTDREIPLKSDEQQHDEVVLHTGSIQDTYREKNSSLGTGMRPKDLSLPQSTVDPEPPVSYDLIFIDKSDQQAKTKSNQKHAFQLSTQTTSPTGGEEDSIAKVLDWFSRSTDSIDLPRTLDGPKAIQSSDKRTEISKSTDEGSFIKETGDFVSVRKNESLKMRRDSNEAKELIATDTETRKEVENDIRERMQSQEVNDINDKSQPPKISHLTSFWEKSNTGHRILIGKSIKPGDKGEKSGHVSAEKEKNKVTKPHTAPDMPTVTGIYNGKGIYDQSASNSGDSSQQQKDTAQSLVINTSTQPNYNDPTLNSNFLKSATSPQEAERRGSVTEILSVNRISPHPRAHIQSGARPDGTPQSRKTSLQDELSKTIPVLHLVTDPDSKKLHSSRNRPSMRDTQGDRQIPPKTQMRRGSSEDIQTRNGEGQSVSLKQKGDTSKKDGLNGPHSIKPGQPNQQSTAEKIKQLKSFWEQEWKKPPLYTRKNKPLGDVKVARGANQSRLNKRFTKSDYDLTSIGHDSGSDDGRSDRNDHNFTVLPLNQTKLSPTLRANRTQFNTLRDFWDEGMPDTKESSKFSPPGIYYVSERPAATKSPQTLQNQSKAPHERQPVSTAANDGKKNLSNYATAECKSSTKDANGEEKPPKSQSRAGKEILSPKRRKDSFCLSSGRGKLIRRTTSMFSLRDPDGKELKMEVSPVHSQSRKQRQNAEKGPLPKRSSEEPETLTPRARAYVPKDYRHYLGMTDESSLRTSPPSAVQDEGSEQNSGYEIDLDGTVRASTPASSEERHSRGGGKTTQRQSWANYSSSDAGQESSVSSTSETWSNSRISSNRENDAEGQSLVRKALRRAEARPRNLAKSMEDITASSSPRQEERQDPTADMRRISNVSSIPSPSSPLFSDPEHLKKISKSVPSFLEKEDSGRDTDFPCEDSDRTGRLMTDSSLNNLTGSSGMLSLSSLSGSVMTMYNGDFGNVEVQGNIHFSLNYVQRLREFHIFVTECRDLAAVDAKRGRSDPYVKSYLVPDKANLGKRKTSVKKKTRNPTFNEILRYRVRMEYLRTQTLILSVWHHDTFGRNSFLGEVDVDLSQWDFDHTRMNYLGLKARTATTLAPSHGQGEMRVAIRFLPEIIRSDGLIKEGPNTGELHIWVKECKNLPPIRATIDPYVKCFVLPDTSRKSRQKTRVLRRTVDPAFNHTMVYDGIRQADLSEACVELTVWDQDRLASNLLGGLRLGLGKGRSYGALVDWMDSTPYEASMWERMMASPTEWVEDMLPLRVLSSAKTGFK